MNESSPFSELTEIWRAVNDYEGLYEVSNLGRVKSLAKIHGRGRGSMREEKILKSGNDSRGYSKISLCKNGEEKCFRIHRLVAEAFIENPENKPEVNHKFGIKTDNRASQLEWTTNLENMRHAFKTGLKNNDHSKKKVAQIKNGEIVKVWESQTEVEKKLGVSQNHISSCCHGKQKTAGGFKWKFAKRYDNSFAGMIAGRAEPQKQLAFERGCERADEDPPVFRQELDE